MKNTFLLILVLTLSTTFVHSQQYFSKGSSIVTGGFNIGLQLDDNENERKTERDRFGFNLQYGRFIKDNLAIGLGMGYHKQEDVTTYDNLSSTRIDSYDYIAVTPKIFVRKYYPVSEKFGLYSNFALSYSAINSTDHYKTDTYERHKQDNGSTTGLSAGLGLYYFIFNKFSLSLNVADLEVSRSAMDVTTQTDDITSHGQNSFIGVYLSNLTSMYELFTINFYF